MQRRFHPRYLAVLAASLFVTSAVLSLFGHCRVSFLIPGTSDYVVVDSRNGSLGLAVNVYAPLSQGLSFSWHPGGFRPASLLGYWQVRGHDAVLEIDVPYVCLGSILLPVLAGCFTKWRFRIWMWLTYLALIALQCAYYAQN